MEVGCNGKSGRSGGGCDRSSEDPQLGCLHTASSYHHHHFQTADPGPSHAHAADPGGHQQAGRYTVLAITNACRSPCDCTGVIVAGPSAEATARPACLPIHSTTPPYTHIPHQATINIGTIGHVAHGKSTVVKAISGVNTVRTKPELERNITIKLGYANAKIYKCDPAEDGVPGNYRCDACAALCLWGRLVEAIKGACHNVVVAWFVGLSRPKPLFSCHRAKGSSAPDTFEEDGKTWKLQRHVSFVDCPGHDILMATMLNGAAVMDAALLLIGACVRACMLGTCGL